MEPREGKRLELLRLPGEAVVRVVTFVRHKAEVQFDRTNLNGKQLAWDRATRAYAQGLAMLRLTCTMLAWNKASLVGQNRMKMVRDWRMKTLLGLDSSDSDDTWSGGDEEVIAVRRMAREGT